MNIKAALTRKIGPLPAWAWLAITAVAIYIYRKREGSSSGSSTTPNTANVVTGEAVYPQYQYPGGGGGGGNDPGGGGGSDPTTSGGTPSTSDTPLPNIPVTIPPVTSAPPTTSTKPPVLRTAKPKGSAAATQQKGKGETPEKHPRSGAALKTANGHTTKSTSRASSRGKQGVKNAKTVANVQGVKNASTVSRRPNSAPSRSTAAVNAGRQEKGSVQAKTPPKTTSRKKK